MVPNQVETAHRVKDLNNNIKSIVSIPQHCNYNTEDTQCSTEVGWSNFFQHDICRNCFACLYDLYDHENPDRWNIVETFFEDIPYKFLVWEYTNPLDHVVMVDEPRRREYWYYLVWTYGPNHNIEDVRKNIDLVANRNLGIFYMDISLEHGEVNGREHYNMRIKSYKAIKKQRFKHYEKIGSIHYQCIRKHTEQNWQAVGNYCTKENELEVLINRE